MVTDENPDSDYTYSLDKRSENEMLTADHKRELTRRYQAGEPMKDLAPAYSISVQYAYRIVKSRQSTGSQESVVRDVAQRGEALWGFAEVISHIAGAGRVQELARKLGLNADDLVKAAVFVLKRAATQADILAEQQRLKLARRKAGRRIPQPLSDFERGPARLPASSGAPLRGRMAAFERGPGGAEEAMTSEEARAYLRPESRSGYVAPEAETSDD